MGSQTSKTEARNNFTAEEVDLLKSCFSSISGNGNAVSARCKKVDIQNCLRKHLSDDWSAKLIQSPCSSLSSLPENHVTFKDYLTALSQLLDTCNEKRALIIFILTLDSFHSVSHLTVDQLQLQATLSRLCQLYETTEKLTVNYATWSFENTTQQRFDTCVAHLVNCLSSNNAHALSQESPKNEINTFGFTEVVKWIGENPVLHCVIDAVLASAFNLMRKVDASNLRCFCFQTIPICATPDPVFRSSLSIHQLLVLNQHLPHEFRSSWRLLFSTKIHGQSFSSFLKRISNQGPCVIIIEDVNGGIFGGFCSQNLSLQPSFFGSEVRAHTQFNCPSCQTNAIGDDRCFLFTLLPTINIFEATGYNNNYCYFNWNQETLPNGLGMGGQLEVGGQAVNCFSLWLSDITEGKSQGGLATYQSKQLSNNENFIIQSVEVWAVGFPPSDLNKKGSIEVASILDRDLQAQALLAMSGKKLHSEGIREPENK